MLYSYKFRSHMCSVVLHQKYLHSLMLNEDAIQQENIKDSLAILFIQHLENTVTL